MDHNRSNFGNQASESPVRSTEGRLSRSPGRMVDRKTNSDTRGPSEATWKRYKNTIIDLYRTNKLSDVMQEMEYQYKFIATLRKRMYDTRFRKWKVTKILKRDQKRKIAEDIAIQHLSGRPNITTNVSNKDLEKTMRWISSQRAASEEIKNVRKSPTDLEQSLPRCVLITRFPSGGRNSQPRLQRHMRHESVGSDLTDEVGSCSLTPTPSSSIESSTSLQESSGPLLDAVASDLSLSRISSSESANTVQWQLTPSPSPPLVLSPDSRNQELIFHAVQLYVSSRLTTGSLDSTQADILTKGSSPFTKLFWSNIKNGLYFLKIASKFPDSRYRSSIAIEEAKSLAQVVLSDEPPLDFVRDILATLSPTNTEIRPSLRDDILSHIVSIASSCHTLGPLHPITIICDALRNDGRDPLLSSLALHVMSEVIREKLGLANPAYYKLMNTIITLTRRTGDLKMAKQMAEVALNAARSECGDDSDQARYAAIELSQSLTKLGDHGHALSLRMGVVGSASSDLVDTDSSAEERLLLRNDTISIHAMEDIAEYYIRFGGVNEGIVWLSRAKMGAEHTWGKTAATGHISDKLENLLEGDLHGQVVDI